MSRPQPNPFSKLALCLFVLLALAAAQDKDKDKDKKSDKPVIAEGSAYNSQEFRFRIILPSGPQVKQEGSTTLFESQDKKGTYWIRVLIIPLDKEAAEKDPRLYFHEFNEGMQIAGSRLDDCLPGAVSGAPAERCSLTRNDLAGVMILVRRGGVAYFVTGEQERGEFNDDQLKATVSTFRLLPEFTTYTFVEQNFRADFPTAPKLAESNGGWVVKAYAAHERYMAMVSIDNLGAPQAVADPARFFPPIERAFEQTLQQLHMKLTDCAPVEFIGGYAAHFCQYDDDLATGKLLLVRRDRKLYSLLANQPRGNGSSAEVDAFARSFKFLK